MRRAFAARSPAARWTYLAALAGIALAGYLLTRQPPVRWHTVLRASPTDGHWVEYAVAAHWRRGQDWRRTCYYYVLRWDHKGVRQDYVLWDDIGEVFLNGLEMRCSRDRRYVWVGTVTDSTEPEAVNGTCALLDLSTGRCWGWNGNTCPAHRRIGSSIPAAPTDLGPGYPDWLPAAKERLVARSKDWWKGWFSDRD